MSNATPPQSQVVPRVLLPELLGFSPQLVLDDIINIANEAVYTTVNGMEEFLLRWAESRPPDAPNSSGEWDASQEVEAGLVAFQTLLESHIDIAFDFLEAWSLRNIFAFPSTLPIVAPHHAGLDLTITKDRETELNNEINDLRFEIDNLRRLKRLYTRAARKSGSQLRRSRARHSALTFLSPPDLERLSILPKKYTAMYEAASSLPPIEREPLSDGPKLDSGRPWETGQSAYNMWVADRLIRRRGGGGTEAAVIANAEDVGSAQDLSGHLQLVREEMGLEEEPRRRAMQEDEEETMEVDEQLS